MLRRTLNLGILAHVDAGKTTLTERLLYTAGVIDSPGSVDAGTTQTDTLALERLRGITIRTAVVSFAIADVTVNLVDTPGHPDFIAEVERSLAVLDGAVLVVSAVEGVQPQTRVLMRALRRLRVPTLVFVNKIDRMGADAVRVLRTISERLTPAVVAMTEPLDEGSRRATVAARGACDRLFASELVEVLADRDDHLLAEYLDDEKGLSAARLRAALASQVGGAFVHPVFHGSALTGAGVDELATGIVELLPASAGDADAPPAGGVFKIERSPAGEKVAYVRMFAGALRAREQIRFGREGEGKITALRVFEAGGARQRTRVVAGEIAKVWGLRDVRVGDSVGEAKPGAIGREFDPPTLQSVVSPVDPGRAGDLRVALEQLAEQDPLIAVRQGAVRQELSVSLYGEVQMEVLQATLADDFGLEVTFRDLTQVYVERPAATGEAVEVLHAESNPYLAEIGLRIDPAHGGSGVAFVLDVDARTTPLYVYKTLSSFEQHMDAYVREALRTGLDGWEVTDCIVTMTHCSYSVPDGPPSRRGPLSTAADFRKLTPLVLGRALEDAGTLVCEPTVRATVEVPTGSISAVIAALTRSGGTVEAQVPGGELSTIDALLSAQAADELRRELPRLTSGEGVLDTTFAGYRPIAVAGRTT